MAENNADNKEGGTGTRAKGEEGSMGNPNSRATGNRYGVQGPADNPYSSHRSRPGAQGRRRVRDDWPAQQRHARGRAAAAAARGCCPGSGGAAPSSMAMATAAAQAPIDGSASPAPGYIDAEAAKRGPARPPAVGAAAKPVEPKPSPISIPGTKGGKANVAGNDCGNTVMDGKRMDSPVNPWAATTCPAW